MEEFRHVLDSLFQGKIKFDDALSMLEVSEDKLHEMIGSYEYIPTREQTYEANKMIIEMIELIEKDVHIIRDRNRSHDIESPNAVSEGLIVLIQSEGIIKVPIASNVDSTEGNYNHYKHGYIW